MNQNKNKSNGMKIVFFGTPDFINPVIETLEKNFNLVKIISNPQQLNSGTIDELKEIKPDLFVVAAFGKILSREILEIPKRGVINIHPSLLPFYRGSSPIQTAILNGDKTTGVTIIKMDEKMDHGPILFQVEEQVLPDDTFESLAKRLFSISANSISSDITRYIEGQTGVVQDESKATYTKLFTKQDGYLDLKKFEIRNSKFEIQRAIRALYPWPGVWTKFRLNDNEVIIKLLPEKSLQVEGRRPMSYKDFKNGYKNGKDFLQKLSLI